MYTLLNVRDSSCTALVLCSENHTRIPTIADHAWDNTLQLRVYCCGSISFARPLISSLLELLSVLFAKPMKLVRCVWVLPSLVLRSIFR